MNDVKRCNYLYAIYDVQMSMWTSPIMMRNDTEAKRYFSRMLKDNVFSDCPVEFYKLGSYQIDSKVSVNPFSFLDIHNPERIFIESSIDDGDEEREQS